MSEIQDCTASQNHQDDPSQSQIEDELLDKFDLEEGLDDLNQDEVANHLEEEENSEQNYHVDNVNEERNESYEQDLYDEEQKKRLKEEADLLFGDRDEEYEDLYN